MAFGVGLLGFISKETLSSDRILGAGKFAIGLSLALYLLSIYRALGSQRKLIETISKAENPEWKPPTVAQIAAEDKQNAKTEWLKQSIKEVRKELTRATNAFVWGGVLLVVSSLVFFLISIVFPPSKSIEVTLKGTVVITPDSRSIRVSDATITGVEANDSTISKRRFEIYNAVLRTTEISR